VYFLPCSMQLVGLARDRLCDGLGETLADGLVDGAVLPLWVVM